MFGFNSINLLLIYEGVMFGLFSHIRLCLIRVLFFFIGRCISYDVSADDDVCNRVHLASMSLLDMSGRLRDYRDPHIAQNTLFLQKIYISFFTVSISFNYYIFET